MKKKTLIILTILSVILVLISYFWIPILSAFNVEIPFLLLIMVLPIVAVCAIPFALCVVALIKSKKENKINKTNKGENVNEKDNTFK